MGGGGVGGPNGDREGTNMDSGAANGVWGLADVSFVE